MYTSAKLASFSSLATLLCCFSSCLCVRASATISILLELYAARYPTRCAYPSIQERRCMQTSIRRVLRWSVKNWVVAESSTRDCLRIHKRIIRVVEPSEFLTRREAFISWISSSPFSFFFCFRVSLSRCNESTRDTCKFRESW